MIADIITRLQEKVTDFRSVEGAASFSALIKRKALPQATPAAHVIPMSLRGSNPDAATGVFRQSITETVGIVITVRPNDHIGARGIDPVEHLKTEVIKAIAGWATDDEVGVFQVTSGSMTSVSGGAVVYTLQFSIADQLRILS
jgi:hypothetical protein